ncbi:MAG TPA: methylated-DNA--[protein]-cysteine S-methyltransferase [Ignavibacteria bacterium]|nr:methylated-DNA--[protein]-cysteine S-methyltransferase [Ignavibacteria bacterium]HMQ98712.1 methylated-DNA--[protein]-cysteine S-methyltransferase [Ignavibacteria bacterium]
MIFYSKFYVSQLKRSFYIAKNENGICYIDLSGSERKFLGRLKKYIKDETVFRPSELSYEISQLKDYFAGRRSDFDMKIYLKGTGFQTSVWQALAGTNYGETVSYSELAKRAGNNKAFRAAATCCAINPVPIIIPCHRVIAKDGTIGGFGGGVDMKKFMLEMERKNSQ